LTVVQRGDVQAHDRESIAQVVNALMPLSQVSCRVQHLRYDPSVLFFRLY
jgi:hypothetical protein